MQEICWIGWIRQEMGKATCPWTPGPGYQQLWSQLPMSYRLQLGECAAAAAGLEAVYSRSHQGELGCVPPTSAHAHNRAGVLHSPAHLAGDLCKLTLLLTAVHEIKHSSVRITSCLITEIDSCLCTLAFFPGQIRPMHGAAEHGHAIVHT